MNRRVFTLRIVVGLMLTFLFLASTAYAEPAKAKFIEDVTIPDRTVIDANTSFIKTWNFTNIGKTTWTGYTLNYSSGPKLGDITSVAIPTTEPGKSVDISVTLYAPKSPTPAVKESEWKIKNQAGSDVKGGLATIKVTINPEAGPNKPNLRTSSYNEENPYAYRKGIEKYGGQCTAFAWGRANEKLGITSLPLKGDAKTWWRSTTLHKESTPRANSIAVWKDKIHGHVAYVEEVKRENVTINEANVEYHPKTDWGGGYDGEPETYSKTEMKTRIGTLLGYIYLPPQITSITPTLTGAGTFDLIINGNNFDVGAIDQIYWKADGSYVGQGTIKSSTSTQIIVSEDFSGSQAGVYIVKVKNLDGQLSNGADLTITTNLPTLLVSPTSGQQGTTFYYSGSQYTPNGEVEWHVREPDGIEYLPIDLTGNVDESGNFNHNYISHCGSMVGTYTIWAIDKSTGNKSNEITEIITASDSCDGPIHNINKGTYYTTIQAAIEESSPGNEIHVDSGMYYENVNVNKQLILRGIDTGAGMPVIDAKGNGNVIMLSSDGCLIEGFIIRNSGNLDVNAGIIITSNNNIIKNNEVSNNKAGISLESSINNVIEDNIVNFNSYPGIALTSSNDNIISNNMVNSNAYYGIELYLSSNNTVIDNIANSNTRYGIFVWKSDNDNKLISNTANNNDYAGIRFYSSSNNEVNNNILDSNIKYGISIYGSNGNIILENNASFSENGIYIDSSSNNLIYHNTIKENTHQAFDNLGPNIWDDGYPSGGNYWSDYIGIDNFNGPSQDIPGSDGIGDTAYLIEGGSCVDRYPLMPP